MDEEIIATTDFLSFTTKYIKTFNADNIKNRLKVHEVPKYLTFNQIKILLKPESLNIHDYYRELEEVIANQ